MFSGCTLCFIAVFIEFVLLIATVGGYIYRDGVVQPESPFIVLGQPFILNCTITNYQGPEDAKSLFFIHKHKRVLSRYVRVKSRRKLELRIPNSRLDHDGIYTCVLKQKDGGDKIIGSQTVTIDYKLKSASTIDCRVYNWERMTCTWQIPTPYNHPENINISLVWAIDNREQSDCPHQVKNQCTWSWLDDQRSFIRDKLYYMVVIVDNVRSGRTAQSPIFKIDTSSIVEPARVSSVETRNINSTCIALKWQQNSLNADDSDKVYRVQFTSDQPSNERIGAIREAEYVKCHLKPYTMYTVTLNCRPKDDGYWSRDMVIQLRTAEDVPTHSPELSAGNFVELSTSQDTRKVVLFWKPIDSQFTNGRITFHRLSYTDMTNEKTAYVDVNDGHATTGILDVRPDVMYKVQVTGWTSVGPSNDPYVVYLPATMDRPAYPGKFVVTASVRNSMTDIRLSWLTPASPGYKLLHYTVYWCVGSYQQKTCHSDIHWTNEVIASLTSYSLQLPGSNYNKFMYGISADYEPYSSGVLWSRCTYMKKYVPVIGPKNFRLSDTNPDHGVSLLWEQYSCEESGHIDYYILHYCHSDGNNCSGTQQTLRLDGERLQYVVRDLKADTTYSLWIIAVSDGGPSPPSIRLLYTVTSPQGLPGFSTAHLAGIVVAGVILLCVLFCFVFLLIRRLHRKDPNASKLEFTEPPPLPNLPFNCGPPLKYPGKYDSLPPSPTSQTPFLSDREMTPMSTTERSNKRTNTLPMNDLNADRIKYARGPRNHITNGYPGTDGNTMVTLPSHYAQRHHPGGVTTFIGADSQLYSPQTDASRLYPRGDDSGIVDQSEHESCDLGGIDVLENSTTKLLPSTDDETAHMPEKSEKSQRRNSRNSSADVSRSASRESCSSKPSTRSSTPKLRHFANRPLPQLPSPPPADAYTSRVAPYYTTDIIDAINKSCSGDELGHEYHVIESDDDRPSTATPGTLNRVDSRSRALDFSHYVIDPHRHASTLQPKHRSPALGIGVRLAKTDDENNDDDGGGGSDPCDVHQHRPLHATQSLQGDGQRDRLRADDAPSQPISDYMFHLPLQYYQDPITRDNLPSTEL